MWQLILLIPMVIGSWTNVLSANSLMSTIETEVSAPSEYLACGAKYSVSGGSISQLQMVWCHEFNWATDQRTGNLNVTDPSSLTEVMCPPDYYVSGMEAQAEETPTKKALIEWKGTTVTYESWYDRSHKNPRLNESGTWHNNCRNSGNSEWI